MSVKAVFKFWFTLVIMAIFFLIKIMVLINLWNSTPKTRLVEFLCLIALVPLFWTMVRDYMGRAKEIKRSKEYREKLSKVLINQSHNALFYEGDVHLGAKELTKNVADSIDVERCSIWLYDDDEKTSIVCEQLYSKCEDKWESGAELFKKDFEPYFAAMENDKIIVANDAETHSATSCFKDVYLKPLGIKAMLDVPIVYRGEAIGVICIESLFKREWLDTEIDFAHLLSSLYTFAYSVKETNLLSKDLLEFEKFVDRAALVSKTDADGKITYVNKKFQEVSGYKLRELIGKNHSIVNSGTHPKNFWSDMYKKTVKERKVWNDIIVNKTKKGELYYVDTYIKAEFDEWDELCGFTSIRYDVTNVIKSTQEIEKKNTYLEHAAKILRHDMHSGINTYIPRGISSLRRRLTPEIIETYKLSAPLKMLEEGLKHTQKVYKGVYEFTNLVKKDAILEKETCDLKKILDDYLDNTAYVKQVAIDYLPTIAVNSSLFCTAIDNLIRNGLKYNDSEFKMVAIFMLDDQHIGIQDNGRGMTQEEFEYLSKPYIRKTNQKEVGTGLGLNICVTILEEHGFRVSCEKNDNGTLMKIKIK